MTERSVRFVSWCLVTASALLPLACASDEMSPASPDNEPPAGVQSAAEAKLSAGVGDLRSELVAGAANVEAALASLNALAAAEPDKLPTAFSAYNRDVADMEFAAEQVARRAAHLRDARQEYRAKWSRDFEMTHNPFIRRDAEQRRAEVGKGVNAVASALQDADAAYGPFLRSLKDIRSFLASDLTPGAVATVKPAVARANAEGQRVRGKVAAVIAELDRISPSPTADGERRVRPQRSSLG